MTTAADMLDAYGKIALDQIQDRSRYFANLERQTPWSYGWTSARCPFHEDEKSSFEFERTTGNWKCLAGCGEGKLFEYLAKVHGITFEDAVFAIVDGLYTPRPCRPGPPEEIRWLTDDDGQRLYQVIPKLR